MRHLDRIIRCGYCARAFARHGRKLSYLHGSGLLDGAVGDEGSAGLGGGGIDLGNGNNTHSGGGESNGGSHFKKFVRSQARVIKIN